MKAVITGIALVGLLCAGAQATEVILSDFNTNAGLFQYSATHSSTSTVSATSTSARTTATGERLEGAGAMKLSLDLAAPTIARERWLAGVTSAGGPAGQPQITASSGSPGYIGYWYKVLSGGASTMKFGLNLDRPANTSATMTGAVWKNAIVDGEWHLVEWRLGTTADWGAVPGIGGGNSNLFAGDPLTIDSIYIYDIPKNANTTILIDYVAWNNAGHIAPEPATLAFLGLGLTCAVARRRRA